jgi:hypothetical protein
MHWVDFGYFYIVWSWLQLFYHLDVCFSVEDNFYRKTGSFGSRKIKVVMNIEHSRNETKQERD